MNPPPDQPPASKAIRAEIDQTRQRMDETIDALGERLKGRHLVDEALHFFRTQTQNGNMNKFKDTFVRSADSAAHSVIDAVKTNPVPLALIGAGVAVYLWNRSHSHAAQWSPREADFRDYGYQEAGFGEVEYAPEDRVPGVGERLGEIGNRVKSQAHDVAQSARDMGAQAVERSRELYRQGRERAASTVNQHPLETGLALLAVGLLAGMALPTSEKVRRQVAPRARALEQRARAVVVGGRQVIRSAAAAARDEAEAQGFPLGSRQEKATSGGQATKDPAPATIPHPVSAESTAPGGGGM
jgi:hypothetical protein